MEAIRKMRRKPGPEFKVVFSQEKSALAIARRSRFLYFPGETAVIRRFEFRLPSFGAVLWGSADLSAGFAESVKR
jgi:hypothetical protein